VARLDWLADVLRAAGQEVVEVPGWKTRGSASYGPVRGVIIHETQGSATSTDSGEINVLINGRGGEHPLAGPIAQLYLSRTGVWHVVAAGTCHHVKDGRSGPFKHVGNDNLLGIEAQHAVSENWARKPVQYAAYVAGVAAILAHTRWDPPVGHKEHQPGDKSDPEFDMDTFRRDVAGAGEDDMTPEQLTAEINRHGALWAALRAVAWQYEGGGIPQNHSTLRVLNDLWVKTERIAFLESKLDGLTTVVQTLADAVRANGPALDTATILARVDQRAVEDSARDAAQREEIAALRAEIDLLRAAPVGGSPP
jgi:hypothetical protein